MKKSLSFFIILVLGGFVFSLKATTIIQLQDTIIVQDTIIDDGKKDSYLREHQRRQGTAVPITEGEMRLFGEGDSIITTPVIIRDSIILLEKKFQPSPTKALLYALIPGGGQIYNRKHWKLPIVYGGVIGFTYAITWNGRMYNDYSKAHRDIVTGTGDSWKNFVDWQGMSEEQLEAAKGRWEPQFKRQKDYFRRNRDLAIILAVGFYALTILDAYVDAHLYNFDVSPDISMRIEPVMYEPTYHTKRAFGLQCSLTF